MNQPTKFTTSFFATICVFIIAFAGTSIQAQTFNLAYDTLKYDEDFGSVTILTDDMFESENSLTYKITNTAYQKAFSNAVLGSSDDGNSILTLTSSADASGMGSLTLEAEDASDEENIITVTQVIMVVVNAVDDAPRSNPENRFKDITINQTVADSTILVDCVNGFVEVDNDGYGLAITFDNKTVTGETFTALTEEDVTDIGNGQFNVTVSADTKYYSDIIITASSNGLSYNDTISLTIDNAPVIKTTKATAAFTANEDFSGTTTFSVDDLYDDSDDSTKAIKLSWTDYLTDSEATIEADTNAIVDVVYNIAARTLSFTSNSNKTGTFSLPVTVSNNVRSVPSTLNFVINAVDDKSSVSFAISDQLLPKNSLIKLNMDELFEDIDNAFDYTGFTISSTNAATIQLLNADKVTALTSPYTLIANENEVYVKALGTVGNKASIKIQNNSVGSSTALVNGLINDKTALVLDGHSGSEVRLGDIVTGTGISGTVTVTAIADQNNITLSSSQSLSDDVALTFTGTVSQFFTLTVGRAIGTYYVSTSGDDSNDGSSLDNAFATIAKAIEEGQNRDIIKIEPGVYQENLVIKEGLTLQSTLYSPTMSEDDIKKTVIKGTKNAGSVITILGTDDVTIRGLAIQGSGDINTDEAGSSRGWIYENGGDPVPQTIIDLFDWRNNEDKDVPDNREKVMASFMNRDDKKSEAVGEGACCVDMWIEAPTVSAKVNGSISGATTVALDGNVGTIEVGDIVSRTDDSNNNEIAKVTAVTDQNNITLSSSTSLADNVDLTFTFPSGEKHLKFTEAGRSFYQAGPGKNYADAVQNVTENIQQATIMRIDSKNIYDKLIASNPGWSFTGMKNIKLKSTKGAGVYVSEASVDLDFVHIFDHHVSESDWINAAGVFAKNARVINITNADIYNNTVQNGDGVGIGVWDSKDLTITDSYINDNFSVGDNNCTSGGLMTYHLESLTLENSIFKNNSDNCGGGVRISNVQNFSVNHILSTDGFTFQDVENHTGLVQNSIFLDRDFNEWGSTKPSKLTIQNNFISSNIRLSFELDRYGSGNITDGLPGFLDEGAGNFNLNNFSQLIGAGTSSSSSSDYVGTVRPSPVGSVPDIGPFESSLGTSQLIFKKFFSEQTMDGCCNFQMISSFDVNNDGIDEIIYLDDPNQGGAIKLFKSADSSSVVIHDDWSEYTMMKPYDLNQDGFLDLILATSSKYGYLMNNGSGAFASDIIELDEVGGINKNRQPKWGDVNGDNRIDMVVGNYDGLIVTEFLYENGTGSIEKNEFRLNQNQEKGWLGDFDQVFLLDMNQDAQMDLFLERRRFDGEVKDLLAFIQQDGEFVYNEDLSLIDELSGVNNWDFDMFVEANDIDKDGDLDIFVSYAPAKPTNNSGYFKRFELSYDDTGNAGWGEQELSVVLENQDLGLFEDLGAGNSVVMNPRFIQLTGNDSLSLVAFISDGGENEWERIYTPYLFSMDKNGNWIKKTAYFSQQFIQQDWPGNGIAQFDFGHFDDNESLDLVFSGRKMNHRQEFNVFTNTYVVAKGQTPEAPEMPVVTVSGSKVEIDFKTTTSFYNVKICEGDDCEILYTTSAGSVPDESSLNYLSPGPKHLEFLLKKGTYSFAVQYISSQYIPSTFTSTDPIEVEGLSFSEQTVLFNDFFNSTHLINIDNDDLPEFYGFKAEYWGNPAQLSIVNIDNPDQIKQFGLDYERQEPLISDFDNDGHADIMYSNLHDPRINWNINENSDDSNSGSESIEMPERYAGWNTRSSGPPNSYIMLDFDLDGTDDLVTAQFMTHDGGAVDFVAYDLKEARQGNNSASLTRLSTRVDPYQNGSNVITGFTGIDYITVNPDMDDDDDYLVAVNWGNESSLFILERKSGGQLKAHYVNNFDPWILELEKLTSEDSGNGLESVLLGLSGEKNEHSDAFTVRFLDKFQTLDLYTDPDFFINLQEEQGNQEKVAILYSHDIQYSFVEYKDFELEGIKFFNDIATADVNNDGLIDIVASGTNSEDTWSAQASVNFYIQNQGGGYDPFISKITESVQDFSVISSINLVDMDQNQKYDVIVSGKYRQSQQGVTLGFTNLEESDLSGNVAVPSALAGYNNGYKVNLTWEDANQAKTAYAVQIGTSSGDYNLNRGKLNQNGIPLFPDRFEGFTQSPNIVFDAYDLADQYFFRVKTIDTYGNTSAFSEEAVIDMSEPFIEIAQSTIPNLEDASVAWGDYDRDGDLDFALMGKEKGFITHIYTNNLGVFEKSDANLLQQSLGQLDWVDYNNDGYLDLVVVGLDVQLTPKIQIYKNIAGTDFELQDNGLEISAASNASIAFGDADADGDLDMVMSGVTLENGNIVYTMQLFSNTFNEGQGVIFAKEKKFNRQGFVDGDIEFADLDNDGDLEIVYAGTGDGGRPIGGIISNTRSGLQSQQHEFNGELALSNASISIGDMDSDGDLDIVSSGTTGGDNPVKVVRTLYNESYQIDDERKRMQFRYEDIEGLLSNGDLDLTDFDNDGDLDIIVSGIDPNNNALTILYAQASGGFIEVNAPFVDVYSSNIKWADFDTDGDMDVFISGSTSAANITALYENNIGTLVNEAPTVPNGILVYNDGFGKVKFEWNRSKDDHTESGSISYVVALGTEEGTSDIFTTESNLTSGSRLSPKPSAGLQNFLELTLDPGTYYMSVQAVDANYVGSEFSDPVKVNLQYDWQELNMRGIIDNTLPGAENASVKFGDFDGDKDLDLAIFGRNEFDQYSLGLLTNKSGSFVKEIWSEPITKGDFDWADVDQNGILDIFYTGESVDTDTRTVAHLLLGYEYSEGGENKVYYQDSGIPFQPMVNSKAKFSDIDNDGSPELIYAGTTSSTSLGVPNVKVYSFKQQQGSSLTAYEVELSVFSFGEQTAVSSFPKLTESSVAFGDYDNDKDIDIILSGDSPLSGKITIIYKNEGVNSNGALVLMQDVINEGLPGVKKGTLDLVDIDTDGDLDFVMSGNADGGDIIKLYRNDAGSFEDISEALGDLVAMSNGKTSFGDFNGDGWSDLLYSGDVVGIGKYTGLAIYEPIERKFRTDLFDLTQFVDAAVAFGDYDNDDDLDMALTGTNRYYGEDPEEPGSKYISKLFVNVRNESYAGLVNTDITVVAGGNGQGYFDQEADKWIFNANQVHQPYSVDVDSEGNLYIAESGYGESKVSKWAPGATEGVLVAGGVVGYPEPLGVGATDNFLGNYIDGIAVDKDGNVFIADYYNNRIQKWASGATEGVTVAGGTNSRDEGLAENETSYLAGPTELVFDDEGNMIIANDDGRVVKWTPGAPTGTILVDGYGWIGDVAVWKNPVPNSANPWDYYLYILDNGYNLVDLWYPEELASEQGEPVLVAGGMQGSGKYDIWSSYGMDVDSEGYIYVADYDNHRVTKWPPLGIIDENNDVEVIAGGFGAGSWFNQLNSPDDVIVDEVSGYLYVTDVGNQRVMRYGGTLDGAISGPQLTVGKFKVNKPPTPPNPAKAKITDNAPPMMSGKLVGTHFDAYPSPLLASSVNLNNRVMNRSIVEKRPGYEAIRKVNNTSSPSSVSQISVSTNEIDPKIVGNWRIPSEEGSYGVGPKKGSTDWYFNGAEGELDDQYCFYDDLYIFGEDGTYTVDQQGNTIVEGWQLANFNDPFSYSCRGPVAPHDGTVHSFYTVDNKVTVEGIGAYVGLPWVTNNGELQTGMDVNEVLQRTYEFELTNNDSVMFMYIRSYDVIESNGIEYPETWWTIKLYRDGYQPENVDGRSVVELGWEASIDDNTESSGLSYALRVGTTPGGNDIMDAQANTNGTRQVSGKGNVEHNTAWNLVLPSGQYYWSVQALDPAYAASSFSEEQTFELLGVLGGVQENFAPIMKGDTFTLATVAESGFEVGRLNAEDYNADVIQYSIIDGNNDDAFAMGNYSGKIKTTGNSIFDIDLTPSYTLTVVASDGYLSDTAQVLINLDQNYAPDVSEANFEVRDIVDDNHTFGPIVATDRNGDYVKFVMLFESGIEESAVEIMEDGYIIIKNSSALEGVNEFIIQASAEDPYEAKTEFQVFVTVEPNYAPTVESVEYILNDTTFVGDELGAITGSDANGDGFTFELIGNIGVQVLGVAELTSDGVFSILDPTTIRDLGYVRFIASVTDDYGKSAEFEILVKLEDAEEEEEEEVLGVGGSLNEFKIYPNPTAGEIEIEMNSGSQLEIVVSDLSGRIIQTKLGNGGNAKIDITKEGAGIYLLTVKDLNSNEVRVIRVVKF